VARTSRKERKVQREKITRAANRGLPTAVVEGRKRGQIVPITDLDNDDSARFAPTESGGARSGGWFSNWPMSLKVLGLATLALLAIGLWRTLSTRNGP
jgi:hypothetical protein